jgi:hypothetical protein
MAFGSVATGDDGSPSHRITLPLQRTAPHCSAYALRRSPAGDIAGAKDLLVDAAEVVAVGNRGDAILGHLRTQQDPSARQPVPQIAFFSIWVQVPRSAVMPDGETAWQYDMRRQHC